MDSIFKNELSGNNGHPSEDELLLYVDGELEAKATNHVRNHLEACWSCRVRTEKIEDTISSFIDYRNQVLKPLVEQPPRGWRGFDGRLNRLSNEVGRPSLFANLRGTLGRIFSAPTWERGSWERGRLVRIFSFDSTVLLRATTAVVAVAVLVAGLRLPQQPSWRAEEQSNRKRRCGRDVRAPSFRAPRLAQKRCGLRFRED